MLARTFTPPPARLEADVAGCERWTVWAYDWAEQNDEPTLRAALVLRCADCAFRQRSPIMLRPALSQMRAASGSATRPRPFRPTIVRS